MSLKQKNIALVIGLVLLVWLSYSLSFSKTLEAKKQYDSFVLEQELFSNIPTKLVSLQQQNVYFDSILKSKRISTESSFQSNLLSTINSFADSTNISVVSFEKPHSFKKDDAEVLTYTFTVKGSFNRITQLIYLLEQEAKLGNILSVNFIKKNNYRRRSNYLECTILLQRIAS